MKLRICQIKTQGQVLLVCLGLAVVMGISLAAIFSYASNQYSAVARSQSWNESLVLAEAGVEDAMQEINKYSDTGTAGSSWNTTSSADNWTALAGSVYYVRRYINSNYYDVYITNSSPNNPVIRSTGVKLWLTTKSGGGSGNLSRTVVVATGSGSLFQAGLLAKAGVDISGNTLVDSYNSQNPSYSTNGRYDAAKRRDKGNVATIVSNMTSAVIVGGSVDIYGKIYTGPGDTIKLNGGGSVGSAAWVDGGNSGIQSGWSQNDLNVSIPDAPTPPTTNLLTLPTKRSNTFQGTNFSNSYMLTAGNYKQAGNISMSGSDTVLVSGRVNLEVTGDISMSGQTKFIVGTNSSLVLYLGKQLDMKGQGLANTTGFATNFIIYGQPSNTQIELGGNATMVGVIYAPYADLRFIGGGSNPYDFSGSAVGRTITLSGKYQVHYDESLAGTPAGASYYITSWKEL